MANKERLIDRLRDRLQGLPGLSEKKMMGGHCFSLNGNMVGGAGCNEAGATRYITHDGVTRSAGTQSMLKTTTEALSQQAASSQARRHAFPS